MPEDSGNLIVYSSGNAELWATGTSYAHARGTTTTGYLYPSGQCTWYAEQEAHAWMGVWPQIGGDAWKWLANAKAHNWPTSLSRNRLGRRLSTWG